MNISDSLDQYADICRDAIKKSSAKLNKSFEILLVEILLLYIKESRIPSPIQISIIASVLRPNVPNTPILSVDQPQN